LSGIQVLPDGLQYFKDLHIFLVIWWLPAEVEVATMVPVVAVPVAF
jgi:hypothetical protein